MREMIRERITSRSNPLVSRVKRLRDQRAARREEGMLLGEGPKLLQEALRWNGTPDTVICVQGVELPPLPPQTRVVEVPPALLETMADTRAPQGILFLSRIPRQTMPEALTGDRYLILDGVQDPGNVGTIWRAADAFRADGLILCNGCADPWSPKTVRATMGAVFRLPAYESGMAEAASGLARAAIPLYAAALSEPCLDVRKTDLSRSAVVIGSEGRGVSQEALALCAGTIRIPMAERCESLNAAVAAAVVLWEMGKDKL